MVLARLGRADGLDQDGQYLAVEAARGQESWDHHFQDNQFCRLLVRVVDHRHKDQPPLCRREAGCLDVVAVD